MAWFFAEAFYGWGGFEIGVGRSNFKIGLGVAAEIEVAGGANFGNWNARPPFAVREPVCRSIGWPSRSTSTTWPTNRNACKIRVW